MNTETNEIWKDVQGYEGLYQVSNLGNVKSLERIDARGHLREEKILKSSKSENGYLQVYLYKEGKPKTCRVHRLVAQAFIPNPNNLSDVDHIDEDKTNNFVSNLEWLSHADNCNHGTRNKRVAKALSKAVLQLSLDGKVLNEFKSTMEVQRQLKYSNCNISNCCNSKCKTAYGFKWRYVA